MLLCRRKHWVSVENPKMIYIASRYLVSFSLGHISCSFVIMPPDRVFAVFSSCAIVAGEFISAIMLSSLFTNIESAVPDGF